MICGAGKELQLIVLDHLQVHSIHVTIVSYKVPLPVIEQIY